MDIPELVAATPQLSTLLYFIYADLVDTLSGEGPFTVFAPTNEAFAKLPKDTLAELLADKDALTAVLLRHVVAGSAIKFRDLPRRGRITTLKTAGGEKIDVSTPNIYTYKQIIIKSSEGEARTIASMLDILATNGVVHLVDTVF